MQPIAPPRRITIVDVARHAQVSTTAVSKVLRNAYGASPAMRAKVRQAIDELGYRPYAAARGLRGQTYTIGVMLPNIRNPFFPEILDGVTDWLGDTDYQVLLGPGCNGEEAEARVTQAMIDRGMDGMILIAPGLTARAPGARRRPSCRPWSSAGTATPPCTTRSPTTTSPARVWSSDHLVGLGHRRIAHIEHLETDPTRLAEMPNADARGRLPPGDAGPRPRRRDRHRIDQLHPGGRLPRRASNCSPGRAARPPSSPAPTSSPWACSKRSPRPAWPFPTTSRSLDTTTRPSPRSARSR